MNRGEIWEVNLDPTIGAEIRKKTSLHHSKPGCVRKAAAEDRSPTHRLEREVQRRSMACQGFAHPEKWSCKGILRRYFPGAFDF